MTDLYAGWVVELNCHCPECKEYVDLLEYPDFWDAHYPYLKIGQDVEDLEVVCPKCGYEFEVNTEY